MFFFSFAKRLDKMLISSSVDYTSPTLVVRPILTVVYVSESVSASFSPGAVAVNTVTIDRVVAFERLV